MLIFGSIVLYGGLAYFLYRALKGKKQWKTFGAFSNCKQYLIKNYNRNIYPTLYLSSDKGE